MDRVALALRLFFCLPFAHSEDIADQDLSVWLNAALRSRGWATPKATATSESQSSVPACRPLAETFASASRSLSGWPLEAREVQRRKGRASGARSSGKPPLSDDDQWPLCANSGHWI
jgi:uncharacterized protein (DUF924 family)